MCTNEEVKKRVRLKLDSVLLAVKVAQTVEGHRDPEGSDAVVEVRMEELMKLHSSYGKKPVGCDNCNGCGDSATDKGSLGADEEEGEEAVDIGPLRLLTFGEALEKVKCGAKIARKGWNGKNQYVFLAEDLEFHTDADLHELEEQGVFVHDALVIKTSAEQIQVGWLASQSDMLSDDWYIVE